MTKSWGTGLILIYSVCFHFCYNNTAMWSYFVHSIPFFDRCRTCATSLHIKNTQRHTHSVHTVHDYRTLRKTNKVICTWTHSQAHAQRHYFPPWPRPSMRLWEWGHTCSGWQGDKRCCFKLWRPSFLGAAVYPPLKYNGGLWRPERQGQSLPSVWCFERRRN